METTIVGALIDSAIGLGAVFGALVVLWVIVAVLGKTFGTAVANKPKPAVAAPAAAPAPVKEPVFAPGSAGELKIFTIPERDAALIMAITADKIKKPLNELRFKSIKEVK